MGCAAIDPGQTVRALATAQPERFGGRPVGYAPGGQDKERTLMPEPPSGIFLTRPFKGKALRMTKRNVPGIRCFARKFAIATLLVNGLATAAEMRRVEIEPPTLELPGTPGMFGVHVTVLPNGNVIVADPWYSLGSAEQTRIGIVALYRPDGTLVSILRGSHAGDRIGSIDDEVAKANILVLENGDFVVASLLWNESRGAVTWGDADTGWGEGAVVEVSPENSLVGSTPGSHVGGNLFALGNGHFVVSSPSWDDGAVLDAGAVTWADGGGGTTGVVSAQNSLIGSHAFDYVGASSVVALANGNYVASSTLWDDGERQNAGAATWCPGEAGCTGRVEDNASLKGNQAGDLAAYHVVPLANGDYVVLSPAWQSGDVPVGAATFRDGTSAAGSAVISPANSVHGSRHSDFQGAYVMPLANGHWVLVAPEWDAEGHEDVGAVAWRHGTAAAATGALSAANALTGSRGGDGELLWAIELANGHYVAGFPFWDDGRGIVDIVDAGAVVWGDGNKGVVGPIDAGSNALVGSSADDRVGWGRAAALAGGDYVVSSPWWDLNGEEDVRVNVGAATRRSGAAPSSDVVSQHNSLVGGSDDDFVDRIVALANGNYVVLVPSWDHGQIANVGAATWCPASGCAGPILAQNSLTGTVADDAVGTGGFALADGNYAILSWQWNENRGAVTWRPGNEAAAGQVTPQNSLTGSAPLDFLGFGFNHYGAFSDGAYLIQNREWDIPHRDAGAIVLARADGGTVDSLRLERADLVAGHSPDSAFYTVWHYGEETRLLAVGDYISNIVTLLRREEDALFRDGFDALP